MGTRHVGITARLRRPKTRANDLPAAPAERQPRNVLKRARRPCELFYAGRSTLKNRPARPRSEARPSQSSGKCGVHILLILHMKFMLTQFAYFCIFLHFLHINLPDPDWGKPGKVLALRVSDYLSPSWTAFDETPAELENHGPWSQAGPLLNYQVWCRETRAWLWLTGQDQTRKATHWHSARPRLSKSVGSLSQWLSSLSPSPTFRVPGPSASSLDNNRRPSAGERAGASAVLVTPYITIYTVRQCWYSYYIM